MAVREKLHPLVYSSFKSGSCEIYLEQDGKTTLLTSPPSHSYAPRASPDGKLIAYLSIGESGYDLKPEIYIMNVDGSDKRRITNDGYLKRDIAWSPDSRWLAYYCHADDGAICVLDMTTYQTKQLASPAIYPAWSPDSSKIVYVAWWNLGDLEIKVVNLDGSEEKLPVTKLVGSKPNWSPDGTRLAFHNNGQVNILSLQDGTITQLTEGYSPVWSPDGESIAYDDFVEDEYYGHRRIFVVGADGANPVQLVEDTLYINSLQWSPDGKQLLFLTSWGQTCLREEGLRAISLRSKQILMSFDDYIDVCNDPHCEIDASWLP